MDSKPRTFDFDETKVEEKIVDFHRVVMEEEQREIVGEIGKFLGNYVDLDNSVLRAFVSMSISLWQAEANKLLKDINDQTPEIRYQAVVEISSHLKILLTGLLTHKEQTTDLENAINLALKLYKETWANR